VELYCNEPIEMCHSRSLGHYSGITARFA